MPFWQWRASQGLVAVAVLKILVGVTAVVAGWAADSLAPGFLPPEVRLVLVATYGLVGTALFVDGRQDSRSRTLGLFLVLIAAAFSHGLLKTGHPLWGATAIAQAAHVEALLAAVLWSFVREFPSKATTGWVAWTSTTAGALSLAIGVALAALAARLPGGATVTGQWPLLLWLMVCAAPVLVARAVTADPVARRPVILFVTGVAVGLLPLALDVILKATVPSWAAFASSPGTSTVVVSVVVGAVLTVPFSTAWAVLVHRVVSIRALARAALQYALARYTVLALVAVPVVWLAGFVYLNRELPIRDLVLGRSGLAVAGSITVAIGLALSRRRWLQALDRRFFREHYDAQRILGTLVDASRSAPSIDHFSERLTKGLDGALHVADQVVLVLDAASDQFLSHQGRVGPLSRQSLIAQLLAASDIPLDVEPGNPASVLRRLGPSDVAWLADAGLHMLVPLRGSGGRLLGVLGLGVKKSELPYSDTDRQLLAAVGASGGMFLERIHGPQSATLTRPSGSPLDTSHLSLAACECPACDRLFESGTTHCECGEALVPAPVPLVLAGKFRLERRIGAGGMGVVYFGTDLALRRPVAVKTMPAGDATSPWRLRREARAMALVSHEHLALIYGAESWKGRPFLVQEYLGGGTLARRLSGGPLPVPDVVALGLVLADALGELHKARLLHGDVKPSNIGYTASGVVKLLDFGLAQLVDAATGDSSASRSPDTTTRSADPLQLHANRAVGTPAYMSPEAVRNESPTVAFDLWSLAVVLLEAVHGTNPFRARTVSGTIRRVEQAEETLAPFVGARRDPIGLLLGEMLRPNPANRPASAREVAARLSLLQVPSESA